MVFKIRTSLKTMEIFQTVGSSEQLQPFVLSKLAISLSIKAEEPLTDADFKRDNNGLELNRQTITGEYDALYKCLIEMNVGRHLDDDEYVRIYLKAHLDRGAALLSNVHKYSGNLFLNLLKMDTMI